MLLNALIFSSPEPQATDKQHEISSKPTVSLKFQMQQKIFVTGGTGFVGSYLLRYLIAKGYKQITALKRSNSPMDLVKEISDHIQWVDGDILDIPFLEKVLKGVDQIYHCAAMISFNQKDREKLFQINGEGTANIVNVALHSSIKKMVHVSSIAAIGKEKEDKWISENTKWQDSKMISNYGKSKYAAEMEVWRGIAEGLNAAILNPSLIIGSGFWDRGTGDIFRLYANGFPFYSSGIGGLVDVRDVAKFAIQLMESDIQEERFIVSAENMAYKDLFSQIAALSESKKPSILINKWMSSLGWRVEAFRSWITRGKPTVTRESVRSANNQSHFNNQKSLDTFGFAYTPIDQTIKETVAQYLKSKGKPVVLPLN